ncbi:MAG: glycosyltransferase family 4 protein [Candidatus Hydrogenedentes bacterium]|nr:glycosyltransferase family 4 protein [Candidatus Hydrogenedentota bacterium]
MHVGVNTLFLIPREVGGTEIYVRSLLPALQALEAGLRLTVFTNRENHDSFADYDRTLIDVAATSRPRRIVAEQTSLPRAAARAGVDVLYSPGYTAPLRATFPQVVTIHDTQFLDFPEDFPWLSRAAQRIIVGGSARRANAITTVSEFSRRRIAERFGVPREKIIVAHSALSGLFAPPKPCALERPFLLYIANTYPHKNATRLVRAFDRIKDCIRHTLVICGQPREGEPPPHPRVKRIHYIAYEELIGMVQAADLVVFPSLYEGFGRPVVEAQEAGTRVIASRSAAIPEIGGDGATYFDGESEDGIAQAIVDALNEPPDVRVQWIARGRENAKRFTWGACASRTLDTFCMALSNN